MLQGLAILQGCLILGKLVGVVPGPWKLVLLPTWGSIVLVVGYAALVIAVTTSQ